MPQESWSYKSFVTCDDPKGVVECKTIRKSKTNSSKMDSQISQKNSHSRKSSAEKEKMDETVKHFHNPTSVQLMEVSKGAKNLNRLIDLWSNGENYHGHHSKDLGKELLKGAIDLQESLSMLEKLQEASQYMAMLKKNHRKVKSERKVDEIMRTRSERRLSVDSYSREEHNRVSRRSFAGYDLFSNYRNTEDEIFFHRRNNELISEMPSTSSNQSYSNTFGTMESSPSSSAPRVDTKPSSLIARLMGLEELPTTTQIQTSLDKQITTEKIINQRSPIVNQKRPMFDIDKANIKKPHFSPLKDESKKRTLKEILETAQLKGLIKSSSFKESKCYESRCYSKDSSIEYSRPIVLIKPIYAPFLGSNEPLTTETMVRKLKTKEEPPVKSIEIGEVAVNNKNFHRESETEEKFKSVKKVVKPEDKGPKIKANDRKVLVSRPEEKSKSKQKNFDRMKFFGPASPPQQKKVASEKKDDCSKKLQNSRTRAGEKESMKLKNVLIAQDQAKATKPRKPETTSDMTNIRISPQRSYSPSSLRKASVTRKSSEQKKNSAKKEKHLASKQDDENSGCKKEEEAIEHVHEVELVDKMIDVCFEADSAKLELEAPTLKVEKIKAPLKVEEIDISDVRFEAESCIDFEKIVHNDIPLNGVIKTGLQSEDRVIYIETDDKSVKTTRSFLLHSPSFLSLAEECFDLMVHAPTTLQTSHKTVLGLENEKLTMDYAKEFIECRSLPDSSTVHSVSLNFTKLRISLEQVLDEVSSGLETLAGYSKSSGGDLNADSLNSMLERDLWGNAVVYGIWEMGWRKGFSVDLLEQVVIDMENMIFSGLIEELFS
ncbi:hypothetical protein ACFE04_011720 [Oxalis oulophora]